MGSRNSHNGFVSGLPKACFVVGWPEQLVRTKAPRTESRLRIGELTAFGPLKAVCTIDLPSIYIPFRFHQFAERSSTAMIGAKV